ncbi:15-hydroxyprostaglandin dehydrogenase, putative, partial [Ixodes scapularis]
LLDCFSKTKSKFGGLDIVVNNAGVAGEARWKKIFAINTAVFCGTLLGFKYMGKDNGHKGGHIINVASVAGAYEINVASSHTMAEKLNDISLTAGGTDLHFNRHGVKVNCICPEPMDTPLWWGVSEFCKTKDDTTSFAQDYDKRVQRIEDVAKGVVKIIEDGQNGSALVALHGQDFKYYNFQE